MDRQVIEQYARGATGPADAIAGLTPAQLDAFPVSGTWSIQQIVIHLMDSDLVGSDRIKRVIAEENPQLISYDESAFARSLFYDKLDAHAACQVFALNRQLMAVILRNLPDAAFQRVGLHNEAGPLTLAQLVQGFVNHLEHHLKFIREKRKLVEK